MSGGVMAVQPHPQATREIAEANAGVRLRLPFGDTEDFDDARDQAKLGELLGLLDPPDPQLRHRHTVTTSPHHSIRMRRQPGAPAAIPA
jgi:hypothetical protein